MQTIRKGKYFNDIKHKENHKNKELNESEDCKIFVKIKQKKDVTDSRSCMKNESKKMNKIISKVKDNVIVIDDEIRDENHVKILEDDIDMVMNEYKKLQFDCRCKHIDYEILVD